MRETVALELSFVNSNLQLLKEQLAELNSSVEVYQNGTGEEPEIPMIPLGLKETKEIDFREPFKVLKLYFDLPKSMLFLVNEHSAQRYILPVSFPVDLFLPYVVVNPSERKLAKRIFVEWVENIHTAGYNGAGAFS